jgi:hypothetical protein
MLSQRCVVTLCSLLQLSVRTLKVWGSMTPVRLRDNPTNITPNIADYSLSVDSREFVLHLFAEKSGSIP